VLVSSEHLVGKVAVIKAVVVVMVVVGPASQVQAPAQAPAHAAQGWQGWQWRGPFGLCAWGPGGAVASVQRRMKTWLHMIMIMVRMVSANGSMRDNPPTLPPTPAPVPAPDPECAGACIHPWPAPSSPCAYAYHVLCTRATRSTRSSTRTRLHPLLLHRRARSA
jgi:hypothetical protein